MKLLTIAPAFLGALAVAEQVLPLGQYARDDVSGVERVKSFMGWIL
ncbi:hypothetical protein ANO14919_034780 [Xylariales sp. No.14919]|nr:hypothetical protein ANO14919_034780 [Xylariales sp. No.14919]